MRGTTPLPRSRLAADPSVGHKPLLPTATVASFKGGVWKTALSVGLAERLAYAGLRVLLLTTDPQEDARSRLAIPPSAPQGAKVSRGAGSVTVVGARGTQAVDLLYRSGPKRLKRGTFDVAVVDTPPVIAGGALPGVLLIATTDGTDASKHLVTMLEKAPENTRVVLVRVWRADQAEWERDSDAICQAVDRPVLYLPDPLPQSKPVKTAHDDGRSVWSLPRRGTTLEFLNGLETLASTFWKGFHSDSLPDMPRRRTSGVYVPGWDDDDAS